MVLSSLFGISGPESLAVSESASPSSDAILLESETLAFESSASGASVI